MWYDALVTNRSAGRALSRATAHEIPRKVPNFWKKGRITSEDMLQLADTGDIIFFSSKMLVASMQRLVTASEYDHTAMFLRFANGELIYFESSSNIGV